MKQRLLLHIGLHKTGSTAIQHFCARNRDCLFEQGFCYPTVASRWNGHHPYAWSLGIRHPHQDDDVEDSATLARGVIEEAQGRHILLSSEDFEFLGPRRMQQLREDFDGLPVSIVVYLRRQDTYLESEYAQHVRMDGTRFSGDIKDFFMSFDFTQRYNYLRLLRRWEEVFGLTALVVRPYQASQFVGGSLFLDFCSAIGAEWDTSFAVPNRAESNVSLSTGALRALREINKLGLESDDRSMILDVLQRQPADEAAVMDEATRRAFNRVFESSNARVAEKYLPGRSNLFDD